MASKKQSSSNSGKNQGSKAGKNAGSKPGKGPGDKSAKKGETAQRFGSGAGKNSGRKGRGVQVSQPKPWGLILTFGGVGVVALGLIVTAVFVVWDRSQPPEGTTSFYGEYDDYADVQEALSNGDVTEDDLEYPWVVQQNHLDAAEGWDGNPPTYNLAPPAGGDHMSQWQTCTGMVYSDPLIDGHAVHSLEHGAVWVTYEPEMLDEGQISGLAEKVDGRDYSLMSPYPGQETAVSLQAWGVKFETDDPNDERIDEFLNAYIQNGDNLAEMNATCSGGVSTTQADAEGGDTGDMTQEEMEALMEEMEGQEGAPDEGAEGEG